MSDTVAATPADPVFDLAARGVRQGASDAREAAARTWDATSLFVSRFVYTTCYTVSYGVVFPTALLARSVPRENVLVRGLVDGARAAVQHVDELRGVPAGSGVEAGKSETRLILDPEEARHTA
jgi:hypothetical protein